ncbi:MAG: SDR family oxidoreductase [Polyangiaceae bacterium]
MADVILLTGITGFLGGALAARWAPRAASISALVRAATEEQGRARVVESLSRFLAPGEAADAARAMQVIVGDIGEEATFFDPRLDAVTHVVHAAACTSFGSTREVWRSNVVGTTLLAERLRRASRLRRFLHVSTAYCCGAQPNRVVEEGDAPRPEHTHVNEYARTKAEAERRLLSMGPEMPLVIARPSIVIGHTSLGVEPSSSLFWYYRALASLGAGPFELDARRDIVPVDYVAEALDFLCHLEAPRWGTYHVSAGVSGAVRVEEIVRSFGQRRAWRTVSPAELGELTADISRLTGDATEARGLSAGLVACARFGALGVDAFDNRRLLAEGFRAPPRFTDYLERCIETSAGKTIYEQLVDRV